jgi:hypothetical protein
MEARFIEYANKRIPEFLTMDLPPPEGNFTDIIGYWAQMEFEEYVSMVLFSTGEKHRFLDGLTLGLATSARIHELVTDELRAWCTPKNMAILRYLSSMPTLVPIPVRRWRRVAHKAVLAWELRHALPLPSDVVSRVMSHIRDKSILGAWQGA